MAQQITSYLSDTITGRIADLASADGEATALVLIDRGEEQRLTRADFARLIDHCAAHLSAGGVEPGSVCVLFFDHQPLCYALFFGAMAIGAIPTFMPTLTAKQEPDAFWSAHRRLFDLIKPVVVFAARDQLEGLAGGLPGHGASLQAYEAIGEGHLNGSPLIASESTALLQHSSGTTGLKKGVALSHRSVLAHSDAYAKAINLTESDVVVSWLPVYHDMGLAACLLLPLITGRPAILMDRMAWLSRPGNLLAAIERHKGTLCWMPNFAFSHLVNICADQPVGDLSTMRLFINCSEPCRPHTEKRFADVFAGWGVTPRMMATCYAMAETVFAISQSKPNQPPAQMDGSGIGPATLSSGTVLAGLIVEIRNEQGCAVESGTVGEIWVSGDWLFDGYYERDDLTAQRTRDGWYQTGDLGQLSADGDLFVVGRTDDLLIINGRNIYAHEVEDALSGLTGLAPGRSLVLGVEDDRAGTRKLTILAETINRPPDDLKKSIRRLINQRFALHPGEIVLLNRGQLHKTTSGKISRHQNLDAYTQGLFHKEIAAA